MNDERSMNPQNIELTKDELDTVVGGFTEGGTIKLKSGRTTCSECGMSNITTMIYCGLDGNSRPSLVTLPCGHQTYIPIRALTEV